MSYKVDIAEVTTFSNEFFSMTIQLIDGLESAKSDVNRVVQMESFTGKAAEATKNYFKQLHVTLIEAFQELFTELQINLDNHLIHFQSYVDSSSSAKIDNHYLFNTDETIASYYKELEKISLVINSILKSISDISYVNPVSLSSVNENKFNVTQTIKQLQQRFLAFTDVGSIDNYNVGKMIYQIETMLGKLNASDPSTRITEFGGKENKDLTSLILTIHTVQQGRPAATSYAMYMAGKKGTLTTSLHPDLRTGKTGYRINANEEALKRLGVTPDFKARSELMYRLPKDPNKWKYHHYALAEKNQATLKYASNKPGSSGWSKTGQEALKKHPELAYWNDKAKLSQKAKTVLKEAGVGALKSFKDAVDVRGIANSGLLKGTGKALGPIGAGLSYYNNLQDANNDGLTGADAATRATVDTAIDLAVGGAVQAGSVALFTVIIPAPGVGTAIGVGVGILANIALNTKWGNSKKTPMDHIKSWFR